MRLQRVVRILVPEGTLMCRTHTTRHELSAIAPNVQWAQLFASLGFADIRVGATSANIVVEAVRTCTHARMHKQQDSRPQPHDDDVIHLHSESELNPIDRLPHSRGVNESLSLGVGRA